MPLINTSVPNLIQGVSQQPDATRFDGQCEEQENALSSVADGLKKRPNTKHIARLMTTAINENSFVHFINRSESEKYVVISTGSKVQVWNLITGQEATIQGATGGYNTLSGDYLYSSDAREDLKALTVADNTFLLNTKQPVALSTTRTTPLEDQALVYIAQGDYKKEYAVTININLISGTAATATANLQRYEAWSTATKKYYRWRITSVTVNSQGQDYENNPEITFTSDTNTYTEATATGNINGAGNLTSINVSNQGSYNGKNWSADGNSWGVNPPTIGVTITSVGGTSNNVTLSSRIWSGDSNSATHASTDFIALLLNDVGSYQGHKYQDFNTLTSAGFHTYFDIVRTGGLIRFKKKSNWEGTFTIRTSDGLAGTGIKSVYKEVGSISDLPQQAFWGLQCKVTGDADLNQDDYYVKFKSNSGDFWGDGSWQETVGFDINKGMNPVTLPKVLIRTDENTFVYENIRIQDREAGDLDSNPDPSFVSNNINNMFFYKDRLGFLSNDTVTLSEAGLGSVTDDGRVAFNFYRNTVTSLLDSAPIGVTVSSTRVTDLESAVGFQENLVLFSRNGQFVMKGGDLLTPRTVSVMPVTNFEYNEQVAPLPLGSYIYYPFERGQHTGLREFAVNASNDTYDSIEVTEHIPSYIPSNISAMVGTTSEDIIALLSDDEKGSLYIYKYFWNNNQKVLSAWSKFTFTGEIRGIEFIESVLYMIMTNNSQTHLVSMPLEPNPSDIVLSESNGTPPNNPNNPDEPDDDDAGSVNDPSLIGDSNEASSYVLLSDKAVVPEGDTVTITLNTTGVADNTTVAYTITGTDITPLDLGISSLTGQFTVVGNTASVTFEIDDTHGIGVEDTETFTLSLDNGENRISVEIINNDGFTVLLVGDDFSSTWWNPELRVTRALDAYGNVVGSGWRYLNNTAYQANPYLYVFDEFESYDAPAYTGFEAVYNTVKYRQSSTGQIPLPTTYVIQGMGMIASIFHTTTLNFTIEEMTGDWEVFLQGNSNSIVDSDIIPLSSADTTVTIPTPTTACDRILWRLTSETGSLRIKNISISMTRPLTAAESYALYGGTEVNP